ncbi:hypothetical protein [Novosphingobium sp. SG720]|uniref:hypothetical protein n=1 Tax=Novosphingobium sp. SG720 TaxID=2586998 RepID=UPI00144862A5|nr:hypothetical protein [Novosphingobium sp. SG720]NKJ43920.1 hypothetical protein [Novosphingobium sp. SG720]
MRKGTLVAASLFAFIGSCEPTLARQDGSEQHRIIVAALSKFEHSPVEILAYTQEKRAGHNVICGIYRKIGRSGSASLFGWIDNKLVMRFGPDWNPATICLIKHYNAPMP